MMEVQKGLGGPGDHVTLSKNDQISIRDDSISEEEGFQQKPSNSGEDPQSGPEGQQNQGSSPTLTQETAEHPHVDTSDETDPHLQQVMNPVRH